MNDFLKIANNAIKHWYIPLIVGIIFLFAGIYTLFSPLESYLALSIIFSMSFLFSGIVEIVFSISNRHSVDNWGWTLTFGIVTSLFGILLLMNPQISITTLPFYVGVVILFRSIVGISYAIDLKKYKILEWGNLMIVAVLGLLFSFILISNPAFAGLTIVVWTGIALISGGIYNVYLAFKLKKLNEKSDKIPEELKEKYASIQKEIESEIKK